MKSFLLSRTKVTGLSLLVFFITLSSDVFGSAQTDSVRLYTPYTRISVPPGQSIDYSIDVINNSKSVKNVDVSLSGIPRSWNYDLKSGAWEIGQLSILPGQMKTINLKVNVPLKVNKGTYRFRVTAGEYGSLTLAVTVSEQGTFNTDLTTNQANMQGNSTSTFTYTANLKNGTAEKQPYALIANAPRGWVVTFKANYQPVTSVEVEPNSTQSVTIEIKPSASVEAGSYKIPVRATSGSTSANLDLEAVITGTYSLELNTPTGLLSADITAGDEKRLELVVKNTGTSLLQEVKMEASAPLNWSVTFDPKSVANLQPGKTETVYSVIKADKKAIPGDYVTNIEAKTPEATSKISLRVSVETPMLWGWIGVMVILFAIGMVWYLFRKYGRR